MIPIASILSPMTRAAMATSFAPLASRPAAAALATAVLRSSSLRRTLATEVTPPGSPTNAAGATHDSGSTASSSQHSSESTSPPPPPSHSSESIDDVRKALLSTALSLVPQYSFSDQALAEAAKMLDLPATVKGLAPHGTRDLVQHLFDEGLVVIREEHERLVAEHAGKKLGVTKTVTHLSRKRLEYMSPYIAQWPDAVKLLTHPTNVPFALHHLHRLVDEIWYCAGDRSFDTNYYTKRGLLAGVYTSTELFMTQDKSPGFADTWVFMDARFKDSAKVGMGASRLKSSLEWGANNLKGVLMSKGIRF
ncbi:COQ9-domain-containing protein [Catenaria anguillulae PL171]|uniref:Ubiquinone biosynthesis protein n=1 Tax=Catenaria anguillulae PL171 TaxID=765915 RepID=A0A1Y2HZM2_9FUNG|nr:COQ9-domain-containing protein [Catenaria anguillulae PL171]